MSRLLQLFKDKKAQRKTAFVAYVTAGDPNLEATGAYVDALVRAGADIIELGVPFSDPVADGPVIQRASERALAAGTTLKRVLEFVSGLRARGVRTPLVLFTYFNPVFAVGVERFAQIAAKAGIDGVLALDLPPEEALEYRQQLATAGLETVFLASPTTNEARFRLIDEASTGFVYYVSRTGVTGVQSEVSATLASEMEHVRRIVRNAVAVGFGIAAPEHVREIARHGDAVVVGSAIVKIIEEYPDPREAAPRIESFVRSLIEAIQTS